MNKQKFKNILTIGTTFILLIAVIGISYAAFNYSGIGQKLNTITTGAITMNYTESTNIISEKKATLDDDDDEETKEQDLFNLIDSMYQGKEKEN
mgnify:CR=1 FL=1